MMKKITKIIFQVLFFLFWCTYGFSQQEKTVQTKAAPVVEKVKAKSIKKIKAQKSKKEHDLEEEENEKYDGPAQAALFDFNRTKNPVTNEVPVEKMWQAVELTEQQKRMVASSANGTASLTWTERGPNSDVTGPSNGNTRANSGKTSGRVDAIMVDSADPSHKTVWIGGRDGGLWKTTDITTSPANWSMVNDYFGNLSVSAITQDPTNYNTMYFCTGESYLEAGAVRGTGVFKSTDHGVTWTRLVNTSSYYYCTRILCDYLGNVYLATRGNGLLRSSDKGATWVDITPAGLSYNICDLEITSTAVNSRLHVVAGIFSTQAYRYTDIAANVSTSSGWIAPVTPFPSYAMRAEIGVSGNTLYAAPADASYQVPTIYKSIDGGANWTATGGQPASGWASGQGWYALTVIINPSNPNECFVGGLDQNKTTDGGATWTRASYWVGTSGQYVHADQHKALWWDGGSKLIFGCDGGIHFSSDGGTTITDRNQGLRLKQFYSCAIHPNAATSPNYLMAGAQDNGTHQLNGAGLTSSVEVTGGDGAYVAIDQVNPLNQFGSYVYSQYRRSVDGGTTWAGFNFSSSAGQFINPFDYDNLKGNFYAGYSAGNYFRWLSAATATTGTSVAISNFAGASVVAVGCSPYTSNRVYFGTNGGRVVMVDNADAATPTATTISDPSMQGYVNSVQLGTSDQTIAATVTSYGVKHVWITTNGGTSWTVCDGNLPDIPVYWAFFNPGDNKRLYIATETGVWETAFLNGANTVWTPHANFPTVRTTMMRYRPTDKTLVASTYGRGLWTATICGSATVTVQPQSSTVCTGTPLNLGITALGDGTLTYQWQVSTNGGATWTNIAGATTNAYSFAVATTDNGKKFRCYVTNGCPSSDTSAVATLTTASGSTGGTLSPSSINACAGTNSTTLTLTGFVGNITRWESSTDGGTTWTSIANTSSSLVVNNLTQTTLYRAVAQSSGCTEAISTVSTVTYLPVSVGPIFIAADNGTLLCPGSATRLTAMSSTGSSTALMNNAMTSTNGYVIFNFRNNNAFPVTITGINSVLYNAGTSKTAAYYRTTPLTGNPGVITVANGWNQFGAATVNLPNGSIQPFLTGLSLTVPAGATYAMCVAATDISGTGGNLFYSNALSVGTASAGGCDIITNSTIGFAGGLIPTSPATAARYFIGSITFTGASSALTNANVLWSPAAGLSATVTNPTACAPANSTTYTVVATNAQGCSSSASINITTNQLPTVTTNPTNTSVCSGTAASFFVGASGTGTNGIGVTYQWQESKDGGATYADLAGSSVYSGVTNPTLSVIPTPGMNGYLYRCVVSGICSPSAISTGAKLTVTTSPTVTVTPNLSCGGVAGLSGSALTGSGADSYVWSPIAGLYTDAAATTAYTGTAAATVYAAPSAFTTYTVVGTNATNGCSSSASTVVNYTPNAPIISPNPAGICIGGNNIVMLTKSLPATLTFNSGTINIPIVDASTTGTAPSTLNVSGIPNGATITSVAVTLNATHTYIGDMSFNLKAPNGKVLNLDRNLTGTGNAGANFTNTVISSAGTRKLSAGTAPFTGTFAADAINALTAGYTYSDPSGYPSTATGFSDLYSVPNGAWTLASADDGAGDSGIIKSWSLTITYQVGLPSTSPVWSPVTYLYTDAAATLPYVAGTPKDTVYSKPPLTPLPGSYTYQAVSNSLPVTTVSTANMSNTPTTVYYTNTFNFRNNNPYPVTIKNISGYTNTTGATNVTAWYNTAPINGTPSVITTANGWNQFGSATITATGANQAFMSNLSLTVPAGATYGILVSSVTTGGTANLVFSNALTVPVASSGGCDIITGPNIGFAGAAVPAAPTLAGYYYIGSVGVTPALTPCSSPAQNVVVNVNDSVKIVTQPSNAGICTNLTGAITVGATGTGLTYLWQVKTSASGTFANIADGSSYSGTNAATLKIISPAASMNGYVYQCVISGASPCGGKTSNAATLTVNPLPTVTIAAAPYQNIYPGLTTILSSAVSPSAAATYTWFNNGTKVSGTASKLPVSIDGVGSYTLTATDVNGCTATSNTVVIGDSTSAKVFVYPNPSSGVFQVRYYNTTNILTYPRGLNVYNARGRRILTKSNPINSPYAPINVDLTNEGAGVYWLEIVDVNNNRLAMGRVEILR